MNDWLLEPVNLPEVCEADNATVNDLLGKLAAHRERNSERGAYYRAKGIGEAMDRRERSPIIPDWYYTLGFTLGWCGKGVDLLARRCRLDTLAWPSGDLDAAGWPHLAVANRFTTEIASAVTEALICGVSFLLTVPGTGRAPRAVVHTISAENATGDWDPDARRLANFLRVSARDEDGAPTKLRLWQDGGGLTAERVSGVWQVTATPGGVPVEAMVYKPRAGRPLGTSRITPAMMSHQDQGVRELVRLEGHMDVYSYPEMVLLGPGREVFKAADWQVMLGRLKAIPDNANQTDARLARAEVRQFSASSPEPHLAALNGYAKLFCREASLPDTALAINDVSNPTSAESYDSSQYELIAEAEGATADFTGPVAATAARMLAIASGDHQDTARFEGVVPVWRDPRFLTRSAQADAGLKQLRGVEWLAETSIGLELLGLTREQIDVALAERDGIQARNLAEQIAALDASAATFEV